MIKLPGIIIKKLYYLFIILGFIYLVTIRLYGVVTNSFPFNFDIGRDLIAARGIATFEKFTLIGQTSGFEGLFYGPSWYYILALIYHPLMGNPTLITGFIALTGILTIFISYFLGKRIGGKGFAFIWVSFLAFTSASIEMSSQIWPPNLIPILWMLSFVILYQIYLRKKIFLNFFLLGIICSLITDMEIVVGLLYTTGIFLGVLVWDRKQFFKKVFFGISGFVLILSPRILFDIRHGFILSKSFMEGINHMVIEGGGGGPVAPFIEKLDRIFSFWSYTLVLDNKFFGAVLLGLIVVFSIIFYKKLEPKVKFFFQITIFAISTSILGILLMGHELWNHYLVIFPLLFITWISLVFAVGLSVKKYKICFLIAAVVLVVANMHLVGWIKQLTSPVWEGDAAVYRNQLFAVDYIYSEASEKEFKYIVYTPAVLDYSYRYLFQWYGERKYNKLPNDNNAEILFVILEPDHEHPQRLIDWLEFRKEDGEVVEEKELKGGIIVQTRKIK